VPEVVSVPSEHQSASQSDRERFEAVRDHIGEDPARWLDHEFVHGEADLMLLDARINGIASEVTLNAWVAVERQLSQGPRRGVLRRLEARRHALDYEDATDLDELGDGGDRVDHDAISVDADRGFDRESEGPAVGSGRISGTRTDPNWTPEPDADETEPDADETEQASLGGESA
jgi:hypothetical protein